MTCISTAVRSNSKYEVNDKGKYDYSIKYCFEIGPGAVKIK